MKGKPFESFEGNSEKKDEFSDKSSIGCNDTTESSKEYDDTIENTPASSFIGRIESGSVEETETAFKNKSHLNIVKLNIFL